MAVDLSGFFRGDDHALEVFVKVKETQKPIDISGWTFTSTLKLSSELPDQPEFDDNGNRQVLQIQQKAEPGDDAKNGRIYLLYPSNMTKDLVPTTYEIDIQCHFDKTTQTLIKSRIPVLPDVTHGDK